MLQILFYHSEFMIPIFILLSLSIICQISIGVLYHKLIWETENMSATQNPSLQQLKLKFSSRSKLYDGISNVAVFVDKYMHQIRIYKISLSTLKHLSGQLVLLAILIAGIAACLGIIKGESFFYIAPFYVISFLGLYSYFAVASLVDISGKAEILRTNLIDYLENHLASRLEQTQLDMKLIQEETPNLPPVNTALSDSEKTLPSSKKEVSLSEEDELETLLRDFLAEHI